MTFEEGVRIDVAEFKLTRGDTVCELHMAGELTIQEPNKVLLPMFEALHQELLDNAIEEIRIDLRHMKLINSSGLVTMIKWGRLLRAAEEEKRYRMIFICNKDYAWQRTSLKNHEILNPNHVVIREE